MVDQGAHIPSVAGSIPAPARTHICELAEISAAYLEVKKNFLNRATRSSGAPGMGLAGFPGGVIPAGEFNLHQNLNKAVRHKQETPSLHNDKTDPMYWTFS